ncbi:MAG: HEAT repeat domain-containing protein [Planctomycetes bacterium]|nr:HEAT repeat domain-containing protein [Planctomycetota bacterium]
MEGRRSPIERLATADDDWGLIAQQAVGNAPRAVVPALRELAGHPDDKVRAEAVRRLVWCREGRDLESYLSDACPDVRIAAAFGIGRLELEALEPHLRRSATDPDPHVRRVAYSSLLDLGLSDSNPAFRAGLGDADWSIRWTSVKGLARNGAPGSIERLVALLRDRDTDTRRRSLNLLAEARAPGAAPHIRRLLDDPSCRTEAALALGETGDRSSVPHLLALADEIAPSLHWSPAITLLARMGAEEILDWAPLFVNTLGDMPRGFLWALNRYACPEGWASVQRARLGRRKYEGTIAGMLDQWERETGIKFSRAVDAHRLQDRTRIRFRSTSVPINEAIEELEGRGFLIIIRSASEILVTGWHDAHAHWREWLRPFAERSTLDR